MELKKFVPVTKEEIKARGWMGLDVLFISGDAYVDHHSFGIALLARFLLSKGYRVAIVPQPKNIDDIKKLGKPELFIGIGTGVVDSMLNNYTADKKYRSNDDYSEGGKAGLRPDNASLAYAKMAKQAFPDAILVGGGVEISTRRLAHYDYWQNKVLPSILVTAGYDYLIYGMAETATLQLCEALKNKSLEAVKNIKGLVYLTDKNEIKNIENKLILPSYEEVKENKKTFLRATKLILEETNPYNAKTLVQYYRNKAVVVNPPSLPLTEKELDYIYNLDFSKEQHFIYKDKIPALDMIKFSITTNRGCFGGCSFCAISLHQGRVVQSRSKDSIIKEVEKLLKMKDFKGIITDLGGPTANMYKLICKDDSAKKICKRYSCLHPNICKNLKTEHNEQIDLLKAVSSIQGVRKVFISSGVRYDLALCDKNYLKQLISEHVSGQLKVAPEHKDPEILSLMHKPSFEVFLKFREVFKEISKSANKEQYLVPYFISSFPGTTENKIRDLENWLKKERWNLQQVQNFIPLPMTLAGAIYWTGLNPKTKEPLYVAKALSDRRKQKLGLQSYKKRTIR